MRKLKKPLIALFILANIYAILCGGLYFFQENLIFHPSPLAQDYTFEFDTSFEEVWVDAEDGARLNGLVFTPETPAKGVILYFHGNAGDAQRWGQLTTSFSDMGYTVVLVDYRNFGKSTGAMSEKALYADADLWYAFAKAKFPAQPLTIYGRSLGTAFAVSVAAKNDVRNVVLETPFYSIADEAKSRFPILPVKSLIKYEFPNYSFINKIKAPITFFHGTEDGVVAYEHGQQLYNLIEGNDKSFVTVPEGGHNDLILFKEYTEVIEDALLR